MDKVTGTTPLFILAHLGAGDAMLCNGLIRTLAERHGAVKLPCYPHNLQAVTFMFSDDPRIEVVEAQSSTHAAAMAVASGNYLGLGYYFDGKFDPKLFDREFYSHANVPFLDRWEKFKLPEIPVTEDEIRFGEFSFVHHDPTRNFVLRVSECGFMPYIAEPDRPYFDHVRSIRNAEEIHVINSSFLILVDSLPEIEGQKLFFHRYPRPTDYPVLKKNWTIIEK